MQSDENYQLSPRQLDCLTLLSTGLTIGEVALRLNISPRTAEQHLEDARMRLGVRTKMEAVVKAVRLGLIPE